MQEKHIRKQTIMMGLLFLIMGGLFAFMDAKALLDPNATVACNGIVTNSLSCKAGTAFIIVLIFIIGLLLVLSPNSWVTKFAALSSKSWSTKYAAFTSSFFKGKS